MKANHFTGFIACFIVFQKRTPCIYLFGGGCSFANGVSSHVWKSTFTNRFSLIKTTKLDKYQACFAGVFSGFNICRVGNAIHIFNSTAF
jgi:hypothetical protein